jgi:CheY-like chemotaxis protein
LVIYGPVPDVARVEPMTLSSMVVSRDWQEVSVLECILGGLHMEVALEEEPQRAMARLNSSKVDALIVDCDLRGSAQFLRELQQDTGRANTLPLVIMGSPQSRNIGATGALFAFDKPISVEQAVRTLSAARNLILDGRLRYHRAGVDVPVALAWNSHKPTEAALVNLSQGGLQVHTHRPVETTKPLRISFALPGTKSMLKAQAEIAWQDQQGNVGIRFVKMSSRQQRTLQLWLAQQYFTN